MLNSDDIDNITLSINLVESEEMDTLGITYLHGDEWIDVMLEKGQNKDIVFDKYHDKLINIDTVIDY